MKNINGINKEKINNSSKKDMKKLIESQISEDSKIESISKELFSKEISIFYIESLINKKLFADNIMSTLDNMSKNNYKLKTDKEIIDFIIKNIPVSSIAKVKNHNEAVFKILSGAVVVACGIYAIFVPIQNIEKRTIAEPPTSRVIKGPREGFVEDVSTNINLIRKRLKTTNLRIKDHFVGQQTHTQICLVYLDGIAKNSIVEEVEKRLESINIDAIIDSYYLESFLEDKKLKFFRRVGNTEKPDVFCSKLLEGRIGLLVDGSPIALTVPYILFEDMQSSEDYYTIPAMATFARIMRLIGLFFAILMPGIYVALQSYNYRILPINFLITLLTSIEGLSVPPLVELLVVLFLFEIITEASLQMPNALTMALSIIGALALGNTAVDAGIISPPSIVVVAVSSVALYIIPDQISETRILRVLFTTIGGIIGLYGILMSLIIVAGYMTSIKSFGVPYFVPYAPRINSDIKDGFVKRPVQQMLKRPELISGKNKIRQKSKNIHDYNINIKEERK